MKQMNKQASILNTKNYKNNLIEGKSTEMLFSKLDSVLDDEGQLELKKSSFNILKQCVPAKVKHSNNYENNTGLIIGYVQSGKTMSFTSVIALAQDNNYRIIIVIAGRQKILLNQTTKRLKEDFKNNKNIAIKEASPKSNAIEIKRINKQFKKQSSKTTVITVLKDHRWINPLANIFSDIVIKDELQKNSILIIDDEADSASLNSKAKSNQKKGVNNFSATFAAIVRLKNAFLKHSYLQYTATPQGPLLINYLNILSPDWAVVLNPGKKYIGGKIYFEDNSKYIKHIPYEGVEEQYPPDVEALAGIPPKSLIYSIREFLIISSIMCYPNNFNKIINENSSMMIHPTYKVNSDTGIKTWYDWTRNIIEDVESEIEYENYKNLKIIYDELKNSTNLDSNLFPNFSEIIDRIENTVIDSLKVWHVVGGQNNTNLEYGTISWDEYPHHILVGGQLLDRGFTVKNLVSTYMPRNTKGKNQADTIEQRCRFFGYKEHYLDFCRVYLPSDLILDYKSYVEHEENIHNFLKDKPLSEFKKTGSKMLLNSNLIATNMSRIDEQILNSTLSGFQYFEPSFPKENNNNEIVEKFLMNLPNEKIILEPNLDKDKRVSRKHYVNQINSNNILDLIKYFDVTSAKETIKKAHIIQYLESVTSDDKAWLIQIGPENTEKRKRTIKINIDNISSGNNIYNISQLSFGGIKSDTKEKGRYFGDRDLIMNDSNENIHYNDELIVQIHQIHILKKDTIIEIDDAIKKLKNTIKIKENSIDEFDEKFIISELENLKHDLNDKVFYTLALNFPRSYKTRYIQKL